MLTDINRVLLPIIRRVMPSVIAARIVGVQAMSGSVGQLFTLRSSLFPVDIWQISELEYEFYSEPHNDIFEWLQDDCVWDYVIFTKVSDLYIKQKTKLIFSEIRGSIEFKLRF